MNWYEKVKRFGELISELAGLYGEMSDELPQLHFVGAPVPAKSEVKKIPRILFPFRTARRIKTRKRTQA